MPSSNDDADARGTVPAAPAKLPFPLPAGLVDAPSQGGAASTAAAAAAAAASSTSATSGGDKVTPHPLQPTRAHARKCPCTTCCHHADRFLFSEPAGGGENALELCAAAFGKETSGGDGVGGSVQFMEGFFPPTLAEKMDALGNLPADATPQERVALLDWSCFERLRQPQSQDAWYASEV